jgi:superfamily II DNA or RNA helicase
LSLRSIAFKEDYRSGRDDALKDFFLPAFKVARRYDRAVGYFSSSALECFAEPLGQFIQFGGTIRLVTSVELRDEDAAVIESGRSAAEVCEERVLEVIGREFGPGAVSTGVRKLGALLEAGRLEIKIATPARGRGIYHEKVGIFHDEGEDYVAFSGSTNESREALLHNYECIDVYPSWEATSRARGKVAHFEALWAGVASGARTYTFPEAAKRKLIRAIKEAPLRGGAAGTGDDEGLWPHQHAAIAELMDKRRGILEMATGTGKTRTALVILGRLIRSSAIQTAIIASDGNDLLDQWWGDVAGVVAESYPRFRLLRHYGANHDRDEYLIDPENTVLLCSRLALQGVLKRLGDTAKHGAILIQDEVHRFGSASHVAQLDGLADTIPWRLGLSATPDREYDQEGNAFIARNVGPVIFSYPLENAIADGILCGFDYVALAWDPNDDDRRAVHALMRRRAASAAGERPMSEEEFRREVSRVYKNSVEKVPLFERFVADHPEALERCIVFVAEKAYGELVREHIHAITPRFHTYFDIDDSAVLREFAIGVIDCLITCHRLSEGIDIQSVRTVVLLSADRARLETIQRIGRCLRIDRNDPDKRALVVDFIRRRAAADGDPTADEERRVWLEGLSTIRRTSRVEGE